MVLQDWYFTICYRLIFGGVEVDKDFVELLVQYFFLAVLKSMENTLHLAVCVLSCGMNGIASKNSFGSVIVWCPLFCESMSSVGSAGAGLRGGWISPGSFFFHTNWNPSMWCMMKDWSCWGGSSPLNIVGVSYALFINWLCLLVDDTSWSCDWLSAKNWTQIWYARNLYVSLFCTEKNGVQEVKRFPYLRS